MADKSWKAFERRIAARHGGQRIPVTGERHGADVLTPLFAIQTKLRKGFPTWLSDYLDGIRATAARHGKIGVLVLKAPRVRDANAMVLLSLKDWEDLHGKACYTATDGDGAIESNPDDERPY